MFPLNPFGTTAFLGQLQISVEAVPLGLHGFTLSRNSRSVNDRRGTAVSATICKTLLEGQA